MTKRFPLIPTIVALGAAMVLVYLGFWQLQRAKWKEHLLERYATAEKLPPIAFPTMPLSDEQLPLFRHATGVCLRVDGHRSIGGENRAGEPGYVQILDCSTGAEGPGMAVEVGWSKDPNAKVNWAGGPVSGIIVPDRFSRMRLVAASAPPGLEPSRVPDVSTASAVSPAGHRGYAATWFALAVTALVIYGLAARKKMKNQS